MKSRAKTSSKIQSALRVSTGGNGAVEPETRASFAERWFPALSFICGLLCLLVVFRPFFWSHFDRILSDPGDGRLYLTILEHWVKVFHGQAQAASPNFFFPERGVLGYSDTLFLDALPYAVLRLLGLDRYLAFQATMMLVTGIGYASMLGLLRRLPRLNPWLQIAGASLFSVSNIYYLQIMHAQLASVAFVPLLCLLAIEYWRASNRNLARAYIATLGILLALLLFTSFYIGWFTILAWMAVFAFFAVCSILSEWSTWPVRRGAELLWMRKFDLLLGFGAFALALVPLVAVYVPVLRHTKGRSMADALHYMPGLLGGFDVGRDNLVWGGLSRRIEDLWTPGGEPGLPAGWPALTICLFVASAFYFIHRLYRSRHSRYSREKQLLLLLSATSLACMALCFASVRVHGGITAWAIVWWLVPGASAIRVPQRIGLVLNVGVVLICVAGMSAFLQAQSGRGVRIRLAAVLLTFALLAEQLNSMPTHVFSRLGEAQRFGKIPPPPKGCSAFFISNEGPGEVNPLVTQTDAMLIAQQFDTPTLNGYSGWFPKGWNLLAGDDGILWAEYRGVNRGLCGLDFAEGRWFQVDPQRPGSPEIPIVNGGFEVGAIAPWIPFHSIEFQVGGAMVHSGKFSLAESSGGGSLYQDVKGLEVGATYEVSAFIAASPESTAIAQLAIADAAGKVPAFSPVVTPTTEWQPVSASVATIAPGTIRIHLYRYGGSGTVYWDDVRIRHR